MTDEEREHCLGLKQRAFTILLNTFTELAQDEEHCWEKALANLRQKAFLLYPGKTDVAYDTAAVLELHIVMLTSMLRATEQHKDEVLK